MKRLIVALGALLLLSACVSTFLPKQGTKVDPEALASLKQGETTYSEAVQKLGTPINLVSNSDGSREALYSYYGQEADSKLNTWYVNIFAGKSQAELQTVNLKFNKNGILESYSSSSSKSCTKGGLLGAMSSSPQNC